MKQRCEEHWKVVACFNKHGEALYQLLLISFDYALQKRDFLKKISSPGWVIGLSEETMLVIQQS